MIVSSHHHEVLRFSQFLSTAQIFIDYGDLRAASALSEMLTTLNQMTLAQRAFHAQV